MVTKRCVNRILDQGEHAEREGGLLEALRLADAILGDFPLHPEARRLRARIWSRTGRMEPALAEFRAMTERNPEDIEARMGIAAILMLQRHYGDAVDHLTSVAKFCHDEFRRCSDTPTAAGAGSRLGGPDYSLGLNDIETSIGAGSRMRRIQQRRIR